MSHEKLMADSIDGYRTHPVHIFPWLNVREGYHSLAATLQETLAASQFDNLIVIDGFSGIAWDRVEANLRPALEGRGLEAEWLSTASCQQSPEQIDALLASTLTDDPVFGRIFRGHLEDIWDAERVAELRKRLLERSSLTVLFGFGASLLTREGVLVYMDVPKDRCQELAGQGEVVNIGATGPLPANEAYKRLYFVDWPMLNRVKRNALPQLDVFVDASDMEQPQFVNGEALRRALQELGQSPFRVKPWFLPGPWGGQWMKDMFGLPPDQQNYAWSYELIAPENGILLSDGTRELEHSFDALLWQESEQVLGPAVAARYGTYFPIRFDYLDTMGGTNLSCQVHPRLDYIRDEFGEPLTQDETYYIVANKPGARVFLGLRDDANLDRFRAAAETARDEGVQFSIDDHVHSVASRPHDLFLIPSGTVHCSGADNLVLEISATPYIYTFKIYDYLRRDLQGQLRHVHLDHAFANIDDTRRAQWADDHLVPEPRVVREGEDWTEYCIGDIDHLFYAIHRLEFSGCIEDSTNNKFVVLNLVEGQCCEIHADGASPATIHFGETIIIPAIVGTYTLRNGGSDKAKVVKAFVK